MGLRRITLDMWIRQLIHELQKPVKDWKASYRDWSDPALFQKWLRLILDYSRRYDMGEGFGLSPVSKNFGLLTFRFLKFFTNLGQELYYNPALTSVPGLSNIWHERKIVNFFIKNETLEIDLAYALQYIGYSLSNSDLEALFAARETKSNTSKRLPASHYYDHDSIEIVKKRENFIIELFGYNVPE